MILTDEHAPDDFLFFFFFFFFFFPLPKRRAFILHLPLDFTIHPSV